MDCSLTSPNLADNRFKWDINTSVAFFTRSRFFANARNVNGYGRYLNSETAFVNSVNDAEEPE